jgi:CHAT domain-containing protein
LTFTRQEAGAIAALTNSKDAMLALDFNASRGTAMGPLLAQYRIVHLAAHGLLDTQAPDRSAIVLSLVDERGSPQNGFLRLHDIYDMNLPAELVVLSACQTALGKHTTGEGLIGLTRGFMYAGSKRVMASLWKVGDRATAELMSTFYRAILKKGQSPAAALRTTQLIFRKRPDCRAPFFWASFTLQGEYR